MIAQRKFAITLRLLAVIFLLQIAAAAQTLAEVVADLDLDGARPVAARLEGAERLDVLGLGHQS